MQRGHPEKVINRAFTKVISAKPPTTAKEPIVFTYTYNPSMKFNKNTITTLLNDLKGDSIKKAFSESRIVMGTRQPPSLHRMLVKSKFPITKPKKWKKPTSLYPCRKCKYHKKGYIKRTTSFKFGQRLQFSWDYTRFFSCDSKNVIYILICRCCWKFYIGETVEIKQRIRKHISDVFHPENTKCKKLVSHLLECSMEKEPYFHIYPVYYVADKARRKFIEKRFIARFRPPLNGDS